MPVKLVHTAPKLEPKSPKPEKVKPEKVKPEKPAKPEKAPKHQSHIKERSIVHPEVRFESFTPKVDDGQPMTHHKAAELLGLEIVENKDDSTSPEIAALTGLFVRLHKNLINRALRTPWLLTLRQEHLQKMWRFNGNPIIIGKTGQVVEGQHRLLSLWLAEMQRTKDGPTTDHWAEKGWNGPVTMECMVLYGMDESDDVFRTFNHELPGTAADTLYRGAYFADKPPADRKALSRMAEFCVSNLWARTGIKNDGFASRRTPAETLEFIERHPHVLEAVRQVYKLNSKDSLQAAKLSPGYVSSVLYMMGCSSSDGNDYRIQDPHREGKEGKKNSLSWENWQAAIDFWKLFCQVGPESPIVAPLRPALMQLDDLQRPLEDKTALLAKAWEAFLSLPTNADGEQLAAITEEDIYLPYVVTTAGKRIRTEFPDLGGIDLGDAKSVREAGLAALNPEKNETAPDPTPEEIKSRLPERPRNGEEETPEEEKARRAAQEVTDKAAAAKRNELKARIRESKKRDGPAKPLSRAEIQEAQTAKARLADEELAQERAASEEGSSVDREGAKNDEQSE